MKDQPGPLTLSENDRRILADWAADCAERVLPIFEEVSPLDSRPRDAIEGARAFARGELRIGPVRALSAKAHEAARGVGNLAATAAARAAGHAAGVAHMGAHARGVAYASIAAGLADPTDSKAAVQEAQWQVNHASPNVRNVMRRLPAPKRSGGALSRLIADMHAKFARSSRPIRNGEK